jgi:hypothetical protein
VTAVAARAKNDRAAESHRDSALRHARNQSESVRDIGPVPAVKNAKRRESCRNDFRLFCETYFKTAFHLAWSDDHLKAIAKIELTTLEAGLFAFAMPRGSGKTTLCKVAVLWALLYGHRRYLVIVGATDSAARKLLAGIKTILETNVLLKEDFPEVCFPIERLQGISRRAAGQTSDGVRTGIVWSTEQLVFPTVKGSNVGGSIIEVAGITGYIRGRQFETQGGEPLRPDMVIVDDPQTKASAKSDGQCEYRKNIIIEDVLGLAGPGNEIAVFMPCTVIRQGDMADQLLNQDLHPEWAGERTKLVYSMPKNIDLWDRYRELRFEGMKAGDHGRSGNQFYKSNREAMDEGAIIAWEARKNKRELSALQHAMNLLFDRGEQAFYSEYQNDPRPIEMLGKIQLKPDSVMSRINNIARRTVPLECVRVTAFIDVQGDLLYYVVCAWADDFTGSVIDYGTYPEQRTSIFTLQSARNRISTELPKAGEEGRIRHGLDRLVPMLLAQRWTRVDGTDLGLSRILVDQGYKQDTVQKFVRECPVKGVLIASKGRSIAAHNKPMSEYHREPGERRGLNWRIKPAVRKTCGRFMEIDTNFWKTFIAERLTTPIGEAGSMSLFGERAQAHYLLADHFASEYGEPTFGHERQVHVWMKRPDKENHWWDCVVGCGVAASEQGCKLDEAKASLSARSADGTPASAFPYSPPAAQGKKRISLKQLQQDRKGRR